MLAAHSEPFSHRGGSRDSKFIVDIFLHDRGHSLSSLEETITISSCPHSDLALGLSLFLGSHCPEINTETGTLHNAFVLVLPFHLCFGGVETIPAVGWGAHQRKLSSFLASPKCRPQGVQAQCKSSVGLGSSVKLLLRDSSALQVRGCKQSMQQPGELSAALPFCSPQPTSSEPRAGHSPSGLASGGQREGKENLLVLLATLFIALLV